MKRIASLFVAALSVLGLGSFASATVIVDDTWADGTRDDQNLPTESAWFTSRPTLASVGTGFLSLTNDPGGSSSQWTTYFTDLGTPSQLGVGDTLTITLNFTVNGVGPQNSSQNWRLAFVDSSAGSRISTDTTATASNYKGYSIFGNFGQTWGRNTGIDLRRRNVISGSDLLGTSGDWLSLGSGGSVTGSTGFSNNVPYTLTVSLFRSNETTMAITAAYSGGGLTNSFSALDTGATAAGGIVTNFDAFVIRPSSALTTATNFIFTQFKVEGPGGGPLPPSIVTQPQDQTVTVAEAAVFSVAAGGGTPLFYQWYFNNTSTPLAGQTNTSLLLTNVQTSQAGGYFVIVTNSQNSVTSQVANLTVNVPTYTPLGVVLDDVWADGSRNDPPITSSNSVWYASASSSLTASVGSMLAAPDAATSRLWVGYFTENAASPVDIAVGHAIKATLVFTPTNVAPKNTSTLRFGLFSYANGATRLSADDFGSGSTGNGSNVRGFLLTENFGAQFGDDTPMEIYARTSFGSIDLMGSTASYTSLGAGPVGSSNAPAFVSGTTYTLEFTVTRTADTAVSVNTKITGGDLNISHTGTESTYGFRRFDAFAMRANRTTDSAEQFNISRFKVEVVEPVIEVGPFSITAVERLNADSVKLTWDSVSGKNYQVQSKAVLDSATWTTNGVVTATGSSTSFTNTGLSAVPQRFYRVVNTD